MKKYIITAFVVLLASHNCFAQKRDFGKDCPCQSAEECLDLINKKVANQPPKNEKKEKNEKNEEGGDKGKIKELMDKIKKQEDEVKKKEKEKEELVKSLELFRKDTTASKKVFADSLAKIKNLRDNIVLLNTKITNDSLNTLKLKSTLDSLRTQNTALATERDKANQAKEAASRLCQMSSGYMSDVIEKLDKKIVELIANGAFDAGKIDEFQIQIKDLNNYTPSPSSQKDKLDAMQKKLDNYVRVVRVLSEAQGYLKSKYGSAKQNQIIGDLNGLLKIQDIPQPQHQEAARLLSIISHYCEKNNSCIEIINEADKLNDVSMSPKAAKDYISPRKDQFQNYPYLNTVLQRKMESPGKKTKVDIERCP